MSKWTAWQRPNNHSIKSNSNIRRITSHEYLRCKVLKAAKMSIVVLWVVTPCSGYQRLGGTYRFHGPEDGGDTFLRNIGNHLQDYTASQPRKPQSTNSNSLWWGTVDEQIPSADLVLTSCNHPVLSTKLVMMFYPQNLSPNRAKKLGRNLNLLFMFVPPLLTKGSRMFPQK
jgi:hypothetical protein